MTMENGKSTNSERSLIYDAIAYSYHRLIVFRDTKAQSNVDTLPNPSPPTVFSLLLLAQRHNGDRHIIYGDMLLSNISPC